MIILYFIIDYENINNLEARLAQSVEHQTFKADIVSEGIRRFQVPYRVYIFVNSIYVQIN